MQDMSQTALCKSLVPHVGVALCQSFLAHVALLLSKFRFSKEKLRNFIFGFLRLDKMDEIGSHVILALCQPLVPHVGLALYQVVNPGF